MGVSEVPEKPIAQLESEDAEELVQFAMPPDDGRHLRDERHLAHRGTRIRAPLAKSCSDDAGEMRVERRVGWQGRIWTGRYLTQTGQAKEIACQLHAESASHSVRS